MRAQIQKSEREWKELLSPLQYQVARKGATEKPYSGEYCDFSELGSYYCVCCNTRLFNSNDKYDAGIGWPTFSRAAYDENILLIQKKKKSGEMLIVVQCSKCHAYLGAFFEDGPPPTGKRYTINSAAIRFAG